MSIQRQYFVGPLIFGWVTLAAGTAAAQVPIPGLTGTIALPWAVDKFYSDLNKLLVVAADGLDISETKTIKVYGESASLDSLRLGTPVVVRYTVSGIQTSAYQMDRTVPGGMEPNEGVVTRVDNKRVTIRFANGATETLRYTSHETKVSEGRVRHGNRILVYSLDEAGRPGVHYFKPTR